MSNADAHMRPDAHYSGEYDPEPEESWLARLRASDIEAERERTEHEAAVYAPADADPRLRAVLDVIAPVLVLPIPWAHHRSPVFEWGHETTPTPEEMVTMAEEIVAAIDATEGP